MLTARQVDDILGFWFGGGDDEMLSTPRLSWFKKDETFDGIIRERFGALWQSLASGWLPFAAPDARSGLAWLIVADQFSRNLHRGSALAFSCDEQARRACRLMLERGLDQALPPLARVFVYLPLEHSENLDDQERSVSLFAALAGEPQCASYLDYAVKHRDVIRRFGRFPHRNAALGRVDTAEEARYLSEPGSGF